MQTRGKRMQADTADEAEQAESTSQAPYADSKTPLQKIAGKIKGALRVKFASWVTDFGGAQGAKPAF